MRVACFEDIVSFTGLNERAGEMFRLSAQPHQTRLRGMRDSGNRKTETPPHGCGGVQAGRRCGREAGRSDPPAAPRDMAEAAPDDAGTASGLPLHLAIRLGCTGRPGWPRAEIARSVFHRRWLDQRIAPASHPAMPATRRCRVNRRAAAPRASRRAFAGSGVRPGPPAVWYRACAALPSAAR